MNRGLNERERAFCKLMAQDYQQSDAALRAGYSETSHRVQATRLMKRDDIRAEINKQKAERARAQAETVNQMITGAVNNGGKVPEALKREFPNSAMGVERGYVQHALVMSTAMALGEVPQKRTIIVRPRAKEGEALPTPIRFDIEVLEADPKAAAYCATLLGKEVDRVEAAAAAAGQGQTIEGELAASPLRLALQAFREKQGLDAPPDDYDPTQEASYP